jgi:hypothetical protein
MAAVAGWLVLGAIAGVVLNRLAGESAGSMPITVIGAMTGALVGGTIVSATLGTAAIGYEAIVALVLLAAVAAARIAVEEGRLGE